jgi:hypothetical protein
MPTGCPNKGDRALWIGRLDGYLDPVSLLPAFLLNMTLSDARIAACESEHPTVCRGDVRPAFEAKRHLDHGVSVSIRTNFRNTL